MPDRQVMKWRKSTSVQSRANLLLSLLLQRQQQRQQRQPHPCLSSPLSSPLSLSSSLFLPSLAPSLEQTLWRRRRDVTPFTAALEPALAAPLRRFPWRWGFGVVNQRGYSADRPGTEPGKFRTPRTGFNWVAAGYFFSGGRRIYSVLYSNRILVLYLRMSSQVCLQFRGQQSAAFHPVILQQTVSCHFTEYDDLVKYNALLSTC